MRRLVIFVIETKSDKENSDGVYLRETVERLIVEGGVDTFLFGSRSKFDELCQIVVTKLKEKYPRIQRIAYLCKHGVMFCGGQVRV